MASDVSSKLGCNFLVETLHTFLTRTYPRLTQVSRKISTSSGNWTHLGKWRGKCTESRVKKQLGCMHLDAYKEHWRVTNLATDSELLCRPAFDLLMDMELQLPAPICKEIRKQGGQ
jgi:hypothetical protein